MIPQNEFTILIELYLSYRIFKTLKSNYVLTKEFLQKDKIMISSLEPLDLKRYNLKLKLTNKTLQEETELVNKSVFHLIKSMPYVDFSFLSENLKTLRINKISSLDGYNNDNNSTALAYYESKYNRIVFINKKHIPHELLHTASSIIKNCIYYIGFTQGSIYSQNNAIGFGLTEGYTKVLENRYFTPDDGYLIERRIAEVIEVLVGKEEMEKMYFTANLPKLVECLSRYDTEENIIRFLRSLDFYNKHYSKTAKLTILEYKYVIMSLNKVINKIMEYYFIKLKNDYDNNLIKNEDELSKKINAFISSFSFNMCPKFKLFEGNSKVLISIGERDIKEKISLVFNPEDIIFVK